MAKRICAVPNCERSAGIQDYCTAHRKRLRRTGRLDENIPLGRGPRAGLVMDRFWQHVDRADGCWIWTSGTQSTGYGFFTLSRGHVTLAHRFAYEITVGPIPEGLQLDHLCRVRNCVRPDHLEPVTPGENVRRAAAVRSSCSNGHPFDAWRTKRGRRYRSCSICRRASDRRSDASRRGTHG